MPSVGFETPISAGTRPQNYALDRAATGTGTKIVIDKKTIEEVNSFNYLGNMISYEKELAIDNKLRNYLKIAGILNKFK